MPKVLIIKPANDIYLQPRQDTSKTDLQSAEIVSIARILQTSKNVSAIHLCCSGIMTIQNNNWLNTNVNVLADNVKCVNLLDLDEATVSHRSSLYDKEDKLLIMCGLFGVNTMFDTSLYAIVNAFKGDVFYVLNDLRLQLPNGVVDKSKITLITQSYAYNGMQQCSSVYKDIKYVPLWLMPLLTHTVRNAHNIERIYDIVIQSMNFKSLGDYRKYEYLSVLEKFKDSERVKFLGPADDAAEKYAHMFLGTVKYNQVKNVLSTSKFSYVVSEDKYNKHLLIPNRIMEAICSGTIPLINDDTYKAISLSLHTANSIGDTMHSYFMQSLLQLVQTSYNASTIINAINTPHYTWLANEMHMQNWLTSIKGHMAHYMCTNTTNALGL